MHGGTCPSCGGREIHASRNGVALGEYTSVGLRPHVDTGFRGGIRPYPSDQFWAYLCATCGLVEFRLHDPGAVEFARQHWMRVTGGQDDAP